MRFLLFVLTVALTAAAHAGAAESQTPTLRVVKRAPVVIEGHGFPANAVVTLVARAPGVVERRTIRPSPLGRFRVVIPRLSLTGRLRCAVGVVIAARTNGGAIVLWQPRGLPDCPSPVRPPSAPAG